MTTEKFKEFKDFKEKWDLM